MRHPADHAHTGHAGHADHSHADHTVHSHGQHAGHSTAMFKNRFWLTLVLSVPVVYFSPMMGDILGYMTPVFPGSAWIPPVLGTAIFLYGGQPFLQGGIRELKGRQPGMMLLIAMAITVAFVASWATSLGIGGFNLDFWWELVLLVAIMLLGHWIEMRALGSAQGALDALAALLPDEADRITADGTETVPVSELREGDTVGRRRPDLRGRRPLPRCRRRPHVRVHHRGGTQRAAPAQSETQPLRGSLTKGRRPSGTSCERVGEISGWVIISDHDDPARDDVYQLLSAHLADMFATSPAESVHALDHSALSGPSITLWTAREDDGLLGCGELRLLDSPQRAGKLGEIKPMCTALGARGRGVATLTLSHILDEAQSGNYTHLYLETGTEGDLAFPKNPQEVPER